MASSRDRLRPIDRPSSCNSSAHRAPAGQVEPGHAADQRGRSVFGLFRKSLSHLLCTELPSQVRSGAMSPPRPLIRWQLKQFISCISFPPLRGLIIGIARGCDLKADGSAKLRSVSESRAVSHRRFVQARVHTAACAGFARSRAADGLLQKDIRQRVLHAGQKDDCTTGLLPTRLNSGAKFSGLRMFAISWQAAQP